jgi:hypothetical protein
MPIGCMSQAAYKGGNKVRMILLVVLSKIIRTINLINCLG